MENKRIVKLEVNIKKPAETTKVTPKNDGLKFLNGSTSSFNMKGGAGK